ncbi:MAG: TIGR04372 family glycosyltransferase [Alphaproteobacteria bacterium]|nr:TIGR04372 family glycosyltransferase [Alphaproteobacteria bacterium]
MIDSASALYRWIVENNIRIAANNPFPWAPGHMMHDTDNLLRMIHLRELDPNRMYIYPLQESHIPAVMADMYRKHFAPHTNVHFMVSNAAVAWCREISQLAPQMTVDIGLSHSKFAWTDPSRARLYPFAGGLHWIVENEVVYRSHLDWLKRRRASPGYQPLRDVPAIQEEEFIRFLGGDTSKLALVHFKHVIANATIPARPEDFDQAFSILKDTGHTIVAVGREECPEYFRKVHGVIDYGKSQFTSFRNDLLLFKAASIALVNASGLTVVGQLLDTPMVSMNSWMLRTGLLTSDRGVFLPAMVRHKASGRLLKFIEHVALIDRRPQPWNMEPDQYAQAGSCGNPLTFRCGELEDYEPLAASPDEVAEAVKEVLLLKERDEPLTSLQVSFQNLTANFHAKWQEGRISRYFAEKHAAAIEPGY